MEANALNQAVNRVKSSIYSVVLMCLLCTFAAQAETGNPHIITKNTPPLLCTNCHVADMNPSKLFFDRKDDELLVTKNNSIDLDAFKLDGVAMCSSCHDPNNVHKVGIKIDFPVPADLPRGKKNDITCLTCHYTHGSLASDRPQASFSFMDRMVDAGRLHKSFLLRRSNVDGELCLICHNVEGSK